MKLLHFSAACLLGLIFNAASLVGLEKIVMNVDVNKTLIATDSAGCKNLEQILNAVLAETYTYRWSPELMKPISYCTYVEEYLLPGPHYDMKLRKKRKILLENFIPFLQQCRHPLEKEVCKSYDLLQKKLHNQVVFPSFLNLIAWLKEEELSYCIVLRTFGKDKEKVAACIQHIFPEDTFYAEGKFEQGKLILKIENQKLCFYKWDEIYELFKTSPGHLALRDDYLSWSGNQRKREFGKKFFLNREDAKTLTLFFDDNVNEEAVSTHNVIDPVDVKRCEHLNISELIKQKKIFRVNTYQAIMDDRYFIHLVEQAITAQKNT
jgi:hypothetical protein